MASLDPPASLDVAVENGRVAVAGAHAVLFTVFFDRLVPDDMAFVEEAAVAWRARHTRFASVAVFRRGVPLPDQATRERAADVAGRSPTPIDIVVLEGSQMWMSAARAALSGIFLLSKRKSEHRVTATVDEAIDVVAELLPAEAAPVRRAFSDFDAWIDASKSTR